MTSAVIKKNKLMAIALVVLAVLTAAMFVIPVRSASAAPNTQPQEAESYPDAEVLSQEAPQPDSEDENSQAGQIFYQKVKVTPGKTYFIEFKHRAQNAGDEMNVFFKPEGTTAAALGTVRSSSTEWSEKVFEVVPEQDVMELSFETISAQSGDITAGSSVQGVQVRSVSNIDVSMTVEPEASDTTPPTRERGRYIKYRITAKNIGGTNAKEVKANLKIVEGLVGTNFKLKDANSGQDVLYKESNGTLSFQMGSGQDGVSIVGGKIAVGETYEYILEMKVTGMKADGYNYIAVGDTVNNNVTVDYMNDAATSAQYRKTSAPDTAFKYDERGVAGVIYLDKNGNNRYDNRDITYSNNEDDTLVVALIDSSGNVVNDPDGNPYVQDIKSNRSGKYAFYGVAPGQYSIRFSNISGLMPSLKSDADEGNRGELSDDKTVSVIKNVDLTQTGMKTKQNIGLVRSYEMAVTTSVDGSNDKRTNESDMAVANYGSTIQTTLTINTKGYHIDTPMELTMIIRKGTYLANTSPAATEVITRASGDTELIWRLDRMEGAGAIHKFSATYVTRKRSKEEFHDTCYVLVKALGDDQLKESSHMVMSDVKSRLRIGKGMGEMTDKEKTDKDEKFLFRLDYQLDNGLPVEYSFYADLVVKKDTTYISKYINNLEPGVYTITELDSNWRYDLFEQSPRTRTMVVSPSDDGQAVFLNHKTNTKWIDGNADVTNKMKALP